MLLLTAATAQATVTVAISGDTLTVTGGGGDDTPRFTYYTSPGPGYTRVFDNSGVLDPIPVGCTRNDVDAIPQDPSKVAVCEDGGTALSLNNLVLTLGGGNDAPVFEECFVSMTIDLGEGGTNSARAPLCGSGAFTVNAGAGQDTVTADDGSNMAITANLGAGDDNFTGGNGNDVAHGGDGHDYLVRSAGDDQHFGEGGSDDIMGGPGNDVEDGGPGDDRIGFSAGISHDDDQGADTLRGGDGSDKLILSNHAGGMTITLDGQANDGAPGEGDNVASDFEHIDGTAANDGFTGSAGHDQFSGGTGNDEIHGGDGPDELDGGGGDDKVFGDAGDDKVEGLNGADMVDGGAGVDQIYGDIGSCSVFCNSDPDELFARDGEKDTVDCGGGADTAHVDSLDVVAFCGSVDRQDLPGASAPPPGPAPAAGPTPAEAAKALGLKVARSIRSKALLRRGLALELTCPGTCRISAKLRLKSKELGAARQTLLAGGLAKLSVKISKKGRKVLSTLKRGKLTLVASVTDAAGKTIKLTRTIAFSR